MATIVVFDGECGLCNGFVAWLIRRDRAGKYLLAGSAGDVGREVIRQAGLPADVGGSTIVLWRGLPDDAATDKARTLTRSDAVLEILAGLPLPWRMARVGRIAPRSWRDRVYAAVAARRPRIDAEDPACGVPPPALVKLWRQRLATADDI
jgi:predicted DCC family thiol-disulfide oxidoreductase YuxK